MKKIYLLLLVIVATSLALKAQIRYVTESGAGLKDGSSWDDASDNLQAIINASDVGDQVWVAKGTYRPTENLTGTADVDKSFILRNGVKIYGGFAGGESSINDRTAISTTNETILSGDFGGGVNAHHVVVNIDNISGVVLNGFTITGGNANGTNSITPGTIAIARNYGGGININTNGSIDFENLIIRNNTSASNAGGMYFNIANDTTLPSNFTSVSFIGNAGTRGGAAYIVTPATATTGILNIVACNFSNNTGTTGGVLSIHRRKVNITNTAFGNNTGANGGVINNESGTININSSIFAANTANNGGGIYNYSGTIAINYSTFTDNTAQNGAAINMVAGTVNVNKSKFYGNKALTGAALGGAVNVYAGIAKVYNSLFYNNEATGGSAIIVGSTSGELTAVNNTFYQNKDTDGNGALSFTNNANVKLYVYNNIFRANTSNSILGDVRRAGVTATQDYQYNLFETDFNNGIETNRNTANNLIYSLSIPLFGANVSNPAAADFLNIVEGQATQKGSNTLATNAGLLPGTDLANNNREQHSIIDLGAYEYQGVLPVTFDYFKAKKEGAIANLSWRTLTENNSSHFMVQRGSSPSNFVDIKRIEANGNTNEPKAYGYIDQNPLAGINYYRLVQYDYNGDHEVLGEQALTFALNGSQNLVYPNPASKYVSVKLPNVSGIATIDLVNLIGQNVISKDYSISASGEITIDLSGVSAGTYVLWINKGKANNDKKLLVVK